MVEANFSHQQQGISSEVSSESPQALEAQQHHLVQEATAEMIRKDAHIADVLSQLRSELQHHSLHADGQSDELQRCKAELRQNLERSNAEGVQIRSLYEENRTATAGFEPEANRL